MPLLLIDVSWLTTFTQVGEFMIKEAIKMYGNRRQNTKNITTKKKKKPSQELTILLRFRVSQSFLSTIWVGG